MRSLVQGLFIKLKHGNDKMWVLGAKKKSNCWIMSSFIISNHIIIIRTHVTCFSQMNHGDTFH